MELIKRYFPDLTDQQINRFGQLEALYNDWNSKINVISRKDIDELYLRHVLHSLAIAKVLRFQPGTRIVDVGTGGGFPAIPLAILFPETHFTPTDSIGKKIKVVQAVADAIGLENVTAVHSRIQDLPGKFDFVVSRAVTAFPDFVDMVRKSVSPVSKNAMPNGILYLKGGDFDDELAPFGNKAETFEIFSFFPEPFFETKKVIYLPVR